jgi:uncharacterized secreted protein with C-terminal beta-propeller domain
MKGKILIKWMVLVIFFIVISCSREKNKGVVEESLLPGTKTPELGIKRGDNRWQFLSAEGFSGEKIILETCPNTVTEITPSMPETETTVEYGYFVSLSDTDFYYPYWFGDYGDVYIMDMMEGGGIPRMENEEGKEIEITEPDITAFKDNYLFSLNRYAGVIISDVADEKEPYIEHIIPVDGYPIEMFIMGRFAVVGVAGYIPFSYYFYSEIPYYYPSYQDSISNLFATPSRIQVWDVKKPEDASLVSEEKVDGSLLQILRMNDVVISLSASPDAVYVSSFKLMAEGLIKKKSTFSIESSGGNIFGNIRYSRMVLNEDTLVVGVAIEEYWERMSPAQWGASYNTRLNVFKINEDGTLDKKGSVSIPGVLDDERMMDIKGNVLRVISGDMWGEGAYAVSVDLNKPEVLDRWRIITEERLYATAFSENYGYAVTFRRTDPLFVIDFSDPKNIKVLGRLEVLGWAEQLYPYKDKLLALGPEDWKTALSLYDVSNPEDPEILSRLYFGEESSASEVYNDYKAFTFLPENNLIIFPYTEMKWRLPVGDYVQIVDYLSDRLQKRGRIEHHGIVRRVIPVQENKFIAVSDKALGILDIADRDNPSRISELRVERKVEDVLGDGDIALLLVDSNYLSILSYLYPEEEISYPYYIYEVVNVENPVAKPVANILSSEPVVWVKQINKDIIILKTQGMTKASFYKLNIKEKRVQGCLSVENFVSSSKLHYDGEKIVQPGMWSASFSEDYPVLYSPKVYFRKSVPLYPYYYFPLDIDFLALIIDPENMNISDALLVEKITSYGYENGNYTSGITGVNGFIGVDSKFLYFSSLKIEASYNDFEYEEKVFPYIIRLDISSLPSFKKEKINIPEIARFYLGGNRFLTKGVDTFSVYEVSSTSPVMVFTFEHNLYSGEVYRTQNYIINTGYSKENWEFIIRSLKITDKGFQKVSEMEIGEMYYYDWCQWASMLFPFEWCDVRWIGGDFAVLDGVIYFEDPSAIRKNKYCLDYTTCLGEINGALILKVDDLSLENSIPITTTLYRTSILYAGSKLFVPRGLMGMEVIEIR